MRGIGYDAELTLCVLASGGRAPQGSALCTHDAMSRESAVKAGFGLDHNNGAAMRESEFDKINAVLDRAQFAIQQIQRKVDEFTSKRAAAQTPEEIAAVDLVADELLLQLRKISDAIHTSNPAPHLRLVSDTE
jgi:hypothetical protein